MSEFIPPERRITPPKKESTQGQMTRRRFLKLAGAAAITLLGTAVFHKCFRQGEGDGSVDNDNKGDEKDLEKYPIDENRISYLFRKKPKIERAEEVVKIRIENIHLSGEVSEYGVVGEDALYGKFQRALRYKVLTDAIEKKYDLPSGILLAMLIQESCGVDVLPNGSQDGGVGLCHMQPIIAEKFGLKVLPHNGKIVDRKHGKQILELIKKEHFDPIRLSRYDDRFNPLINLDAVARMLVFYIHKRGKRNGNLRYALRRYAGKKNYEKYWKQVRFYMKLLRDEDFLKDVEKVFNKNNKDLVINEKRARDPFREYIATFSKANAENYHLEEYMKNNPNWTSEKLRDIKKSIDSFLK